MSRRYVREGDKLKNSWPFRTGIRPVADSIIWESIAFQYNHYMRPTAEASLRLQQTDLRVLQKYYDHLAGISDRQRRRYEKFSCRPGGVVTSEAIGATVTGATDEPSGATLEEKAKADRDSLAGFDGPHWMRPSSHFYYATFIPNPTPTLATSNPFCLDSNNKSGWKATVNKKSQGPRPLPGRTIGGTDDRQVVSITPSWA